MPSLGSIRAAPFALGAKARVQGTVSPWLGAKLAGEARWPGSFVVVLTSPARHRVQANTENTPLSPSREHVRTPPCFIMGLVAPFAGAGRSR